MTITEEIRRNEERLEALRKDWQNATKPMYRKFIEANAKILKEKTEVLKKRVERES